MKITCTFIFVLFVSLTSWTAVPSDTFRLANKAMEKDAFNDAIQLYESILQSGYQSSSLYHNLVLAHINNNNWTWARFYAEKGLIEYPMDKNLNHNLDIIMQKVNDPYHFIPLPLNSVLKLLQKAGGKNFLSLLLLVIFLVNLILFYFKDVKQRTYYLAVSVVFFIGILFCFTLERIQDRRNAQMAIVWQQEVKLYAKPDTAENASVDLISGQKVRILETLGNWHHVELAEGTTGWLENQKIRKIIS